MAATCSFDVTSKVDLQEVDNALNQARKEVVQRYDFKGSKASIAFDKAKASITLVADDDFKMKALFDLLQGRLIKRGVPVKNLKFGDVEAATGQSVRAVVSLTQGIDGETAKKIVKAIKEKGFKKVQSAIQGEEIRVSSPSRDDLQAVIAFVRGEDFGIELKFGNFRS